MMLGDFFLIGEWMKFTSLSPPVTRVFTQPEMFHPNFLVAHPVSMIIPRVFGNPSSRQAIVVSLVPLLDLPFDSLSRFPAFRVPVPEGCTGGGQTNAGLQVPTGIPGQLAELGREKSRALGEGRCARLHAWCIPCRGLGDIRKFRSLL